MQRPDRATITAVADGSHFFAGKVVAGTYVLVRPLAEGGMGAVWLATHRELETELAVKFMAPDLVASSHLRARFKREAKAAAQLKSRHVVRILDHGVDEDVPYIAMELLDGEDLRSRLRRVRRLTVPETLVILTQAAKALGPAHALGIVHRDLKPANIFLAQSDGEEVVKVLDFGVAKLTTAPDDGESTRTGVVVGSPNYMSPEQARTTDSVDHRSDIWSMGVILFRCLVGRAPFRGQTMADVIVKICAEPVPRATELAPDLPLAVDGFFERALARDRDQRFGSLDEMIEALRAIADDESPKPSTPRLRPPLSSAPFTSTYGSAPVFDQEPTTVAHVAAHVATVGTLTGSGTVTTAYPSRGSSRWLAWVGLALAIVAVVGGGLWSFQGSESTGARRDDRGASEETEPVASPVSEAAAQSPAAAVTATASASVSPAAELPSAVPASSVAPPTPKPSAAAPPTRRKPDPPRETPTPEKPKWGF